MNCVRCGMDVGGTIHLFWGDEKRCRDVEMAFGQPGSLCKNPVGKVEPRLCSCGRYLFDFDIPCPLCGKTYAAIPS